MKHCPLLFTFTDRVSGNGFLADIVAHGRALAVQEGEAEHWFYGVNPGGLAAVGTDESNAYLEFRKEYTLVLHEIAEDVKTFAEFKAEVDRFFSETNVPTEQEWKRAVEAVRAGRISAKGIPRLPAESPRFVEVTERIHFSVNDNTLDVRPAIAA